MQVTRGFGSDNNAGVHPAVMAALAAANQGHVPGYGDDPYTRAAVDLFRGIFGEAAQVFFVFGGTGANVLGLAAGLEPYQSVICAATAHINVDECGAPERFTGCKLLDLPAPGGKLTPEGVEAALVGVGDVHVAQPRIVSITQPTELGTLYTPGEVAALARMAHSRGLLLHMDGARIANAAAALDEPVRAFTSDAGVDLLSFGGTKNGMMYGEAVVLLRPDLAQRAAFLHKQTMQLPSKMRFIAAQFSALLADGLWLKNARHANAMAQRLANGIEQIPGLRVAFPVQANAVFFHAPPQVLHSLHQRYFFYEEYGAARLMCSFDTAEPDVDCLLESLSFLADQATIEDSTNMPGDFPPS